MPLIPFPNVPNVPGVPALARSVTVPTASGLFVRALGALAAELFGQNVWGVFDSQGNSAIDFDSFVSIDYQNNTRVSQAPQEKGSFSSYNKVNNPYDCSIVLSIGADKASRTKFLTRLQEILNSVELYTVVTPEQTYLNATLENYSFKREASNGTTLIKAQLNFVEIRSGATTTTTQTKDPSGATFVNDGQLQPYNPSQSDIDLASTAV
jgi:hypothetical protein